LKEKITVDFVTTQESEATETYKPFENSNSKMETCTNLNKNNLEVNMNVFTKSENKTTMNEYNVSFEREIARNKYLKNVRRNFYGFQFRPLNAINAIETFTKVEELLNISSLQIQLNSENKR